MKLHLVLVFASLSFSPFGSRLAAQEKVALEEPKQPDLVAELRTQPDGVLRVRSNLDGTFKSLVIKAGVEIEDVLGSQKGKQLARKEVETKCKQYLAKWLEENCTFVEDSKNVTTIITKGESAKDAAGNTVKLKQQQGTQTKTITESSTSLANATLRGLIVLHSEITEGKDQEYMLIMGLSQDTVAQSKEVARAIAGRPSGAPGNAGNGEDRLVPERKTNPAVKDF